MLNRPKLHPDCTQRSFALRLVALQPIGKSLIYIISRVFGTARGRSLTVGNQFNSLLASGAQGTHLHRVEYNLSACRRPGTPVPLTLRSPFVILSMIPQPRKHA